MFQGVSKKHRTIRFGPGGGWSNGRTARFTARQSRFESGSPINPNKRGRGVPAPRPLIKNPGIWPHEDDRPVHIARTARTFRSPAHRGCGDRSSTPASNCPPKATEAASMSRPSSTSTITPDRGEPLPGKPQSHKPRVRMRWLTTGAKLCRGRSKVCESAVRVGRPSLVLAMTAVLQWRRVVAQSRWTDDTFYISGYISADISGGTLPPERPLLKRLRGSLAAKSWALAG